MTFLILTRPNYLHVRFPVSATYGLWIPSVVGYLTVTPWQHTAVAAHWNPGKQTGVRLRSKKSWIKGFRHGLVSRSLEWQRDSWTMMSGSFATLWTNKISSEGENNFTSCQALECAYLKAKSTKITTFACHWPHGFHWITGIGVCRGGVKLLWYYRKFSKEQSWGYKDIRNILRG